MTEAALLVRTFRVGRRTVTLDVQAPVAAAARHFITAAWSPDVPQHLNRAERRAFRSGMEAALAEVAQELGVSVAAVGGYDDAGNVLAALRGAPAS